MQSDGVQVLFMLTAPVDYIQFAQQAGGQGYRPQFVGVGITKGLNAVLGAGCPDVDKGIFFSPFPGLDWARKNAARVLRRRAASSACPPTTSRSRCGAWPRSQHEMFKRYEQAYKSTDLTREDFVDMLADPDRHRDRSLPAAVTSRPTDHFGAPAGARAQGRLRGGEHKTLATFASGF